MQRTMIITACLAIAAPGVAAAAAAGAESEVQVGEIVVTAQRREERLRDVPLSVSVVTSETVASAGLLGMRDLQQVTPGLVTQNSGIQYRPTIRGIGGFAGGGAGDEQNISIYIDNVYQAQPSATAFNLMNIDRIEVLKGPQGTLFGRNATGGAIRVVTSDPKFQPSLRGFGAYGFRLKSREFGAYGETGLTQSLAVSFNGYYYKDDGFVRNINPAWTGGKLARQEAMDLRAKVLFQPNDQFKVILGGQIGYSKSSQELTTAPIPSVFGFANVAGVVIPTKPLTTSLNFEGFTTAKSRTIYATASYDLGKVALESTSAYRHVTLGYYFDVDRTNLPLTVSFAYGPQKVFTQEFIATTKFDGPFNVVAGAFYFHADSAYDAGGLYNAPLSAPVGGVRTPLGPPALIANTRSAVDTKSYAGFGEATWEIAPRLTLIGGARYTYEKKDARVLNMLALPLGASTGHLSFDNVSYRATVRYKYSDEGMVYLTRSTGFKSGQFNASVRTVPLGTVRPEKLNAMEFGLKDRPLPWLDVTFAAYDYRYKDIQLTVFNTFNPALGTTILLNAANAHARGAELNLAARPTSNTRASLGVSYMPTAKYTNFPNAIDYVPRPDGLGATQVITNLSGTRIPYTPKFTFDVGAGVTLDALGGKLDLDANAYYKTRFEWIPGNRFGQPRLLILNATANWTSPDGRYTVGVYGRNLTNKHYLASGGATTAGFSGFWARPREIGVKAGFKLP